MPKGQEGLIDIKLWNAVAPSPTEIASAFAAFAGMRVLHILPRLVMVRRAIDAGFYTDDLPRHRGARRGPPNSPQISLPRRPVRRDQRP
jgi:hypothetical protein